MEKYPKITDFIKAKNKLKHVKFGDLPNIDEHPYFIDSATIGHLWIYDLINAEGFDYIVPLLNYAKLKKTCLFEWNINKEMYDEILELYKNSNSQPKMMINENLELSSYYDLLGMAKTHRNEFNALSKLLVILHKLDMISIVEGNHDFITYPNVDLKMFLEENAPYINAFYIGATILLEDNQFDIPQDMIDILYNISKCSTTWKELKYYPKQNESMNLFNNIIGYFIENWYWFDEKDKIIFMKYVYNVRVVQELISSLLGANGILSAISLRVIFDNFWQSKYLIDNGKVEDYYKHCINRMQLYYAKDIKDEASFDIFKVELNRALYNSIPLNPDFFNNIGTVREVCDNLGIKELYDKYYEFNSEFVHGSITGLYFGLLETCSNKEHLEHLTINKTSSRHIDSLTDIFRLLNLHSELLNHYLGYDFLPNLDIKDYVFNSREDFKKYIDGVVKKRNE